MLYGPYKESLYNNFGQAIDLRFYNDNELVTNYTNPEPRLGINYKLNDKSSIKISYARLFQYIQNIYNTNTPLPTSRWKISDRYISPQKNDTYGLGYYKIFQILSLNYHWKVITGTQKITLHINLVLIFSL